MKHGAITPKNTIMIMNKLIKMLTENTITKKNIMKMGTFSLKKIGLMTVKEDLTVTMKKET